MRVLLVHDKDLAPAAVGGGKGICGPTAGGLSVHLAGLVPALRKACERVTVVAFVPGFEIGGEAGAANGEEHGSDGPHRLPAFRFRYRPDVAAALAELVRAERPDVVHLQSVTSIHPRLVRALARAAPLVWSFHDSSALCFRRTLLDAADRVCARPLGLGCVTGGCYRPGMLEHPAVDALRIAAHRTSLRSLRRAALALAPSRWLAAALVRNGLDAGRVAVAPLFPRFEGAEAGAPDGTPPRLLFVGRLSREKGAPLLLEALARLAGESWSAELVGDGPLRSELERGARAAGLGERLRLAGELAGPALADAYRAADVVVLPSLAPESFGLVGVEAMAHGRPVVACDAGGVSEWLRDGETGLLARHGDATHLAERLREALRDPSLRARLGAAGRRLQRERFTERAHVALLLDAYRRAAAAAGSPR